jgi:hypothetical protein
MQKPFQNSNQKHYEMHFFHMLYVKNKIQAKVHSSDGHQVAQWSTCVCFSSWLYVSDFFPPRHCPGLEFPIIFWHIFSRAKFNHSGAFAIWISFRDVKKLLLRFLSSLPHPF